MKIRDRISELRRVPASELRPNPKNWRTHPKAQADALKGVLAEVGIADAVLARELEDGTLMLLDGHLRVETMGDQILPVLVLDVDEAEGDKVLATLDPLAAMAESDAAKLDAILREVDTGSPELQQMLSDLAEDAGLYQDEAKEIVEDEVPEPPVDPITKPGDLWLLGDHRLLCGDSTKSEDVERLMAGAKADMMVTDPPYGVEYDADWRNQAKRPDGTAYGASALGKVSNDDRADWRESWALFHGDIAYVWHAGCRSPEVAESLTVCDFVIRNLIVWAKNSMVIGRGDYHHQHEPCWYVVRKGCPGRRTDDRTQTTLWQIDKPQKSETGHSTQKPVECMARPMRNHEAELIYDPFLGSGTTLIAAEQLGRKCYGMEISPAYCHVIVKRWETLTGKKAELEKAAKKSKAK
jgi:DNA modification methylase